MRAIRSLLLVPLPLGVLATGCEAPLNLIVNTTNIPAEADGLQFLVRSIDDHTSGGAAPTQLAISKDGSQIISFASAPPSAQDGTYSFGLYVKSTDQSAKSSRIQVNVAATQKGCPIAVGANEATEPLSLQPLIVNLTKAPARGTTDPTQGCDSGKPQIFAVVGTEMTTNRLPATFRMLLKGWGFYPNTSLEIYLDSNNDFTSMHAPVPFPVGTSENASELHVDLSSEDYKVAKMTLTDAFNGIGGIQLAVTNPDNQQTKVRLSDLK